MKKEYYVVKYKRYFPDYDLWNDISKEFLYLSGAEEHIDKIIESMEDHIYYKDISIVKHIEILISNDRLEKQKKQVKSKTRTLEKNEKLIYKALRLSIKTLDKLKREGRV